MTDPTRRSGPGLKPRAIFGDPVGVTNARTPKGSPAIARGFNPGRASRVRTAALFALCLLAGTGCRQQMAEQPYYRPYEPSELFADGRSARPLERGVIHRAQYLETDPMVTGLTREEWGRAFARRQNPVADLAAPTPIENRELTIGAPRFDPRVPGNPKVYADEFPFPVTSDDLDRGRDRYQIYCAVCHGPLGNGQGKIWERGYLKPPSFHTEMVGDHELDRGKYESQAAPLGNSRGYGLWGISIPLREVPVGYIYEVIAKGYGGMPNYAAQVSPADRWRIVAYVRALQYSQHAAADTLPPELRKKVDAAGGKQ